jgi:hypothetical protein
MKSILREFIELNDDEKKDLWSKATFIFDTNILLNLYRYSLKTRKALLNAFDSLKDNIWIPYNVAFEFMNNRCEVIHESNERYDKLFKEVKNFKSVILNSLRLSENDSEIKDLEKFLNKWLKNNKEKNNLNCEYNKDPILDVIFKYFDGRTGLPFDNAQLNAVFEEGKKRYEKNIPPGFKDSKKKEDNNMYGDLIIWKQIINYAKENKKDIIFVTQDQKIDWWNIVHGKTIGPRFELRKEFYDNTNQSFHMYAMDNFLAKFDEQSGIDIEQSVIDEVKLYDKQIYFSNPLKEYNELNKKEKNQLLKLIFQNEISHHNNISSKSIENIATDYYIDKLEREVKLNNLKIAYDEQIEKGLDSEENDTNLLREILSRE